MECEGIAAQAVTIIGFFTVVGFACSFVLTVTYPLQVIIVSLFKKQATSLWKIWFNYMLVTAILFLLLLGLMVAGQALNCYWMIA